MRIVIYHGPPVTCLATTPRGRGGVNAAAGAQIDLDEVIGADGYTVEAALGPLVAHCHPIESPKAVVYEGLPADEGLEIPIAARPKKGKE